MKTFLVAGIFFLASVVYTTAGELRYVVQPRSQLDQATVITSVIPLS